MLYKCSINWINFINVKTIKDQKKLKSLKSECFLLMSSSKIRTTSTGIQGAVCRKVERKVKFPSWSRSTLKNAGFISWITAILRSKYPLTLECTFYWWEHVKCPNVWPNHRQQTLSLVPSPSWLRGSLGKIRTANAREIVHLFNTTTPLSYTESWQKYIF